MDTKRPSDPVLPPGPDAAWARLLELVRVLRGPGGCPWDREQTTVSLATHLVEESHEVLHAAQEGHPGALGEELGDAAFLLAIVTQAAEEEGAPGFAEVLDAAASKIVRRHPHVFGGAPVADASEAARLWEVQKRLERGPEHPRVEAEALPDPPPALPALLQAQRVQQKAAAVGFDWPHAAAVISKIEEELAELRGAMEGGEAASLREEAGDLLFATVNLVRVLGLDAETTMRAASRKFRERFNRMARRIRADGHLPEELALDRLEEYWQVTKDEERGVKP
jgi:nucleoside triphosphate diphosphatase